MKVRGTKRELVEIEVEKRDLLPLVERVLHDQYPELNKIEFIRDGWVYIADGVNYHHNELEYKKDHVASVEEVRLVRFRKDLIDLFIM
jgi:hypothetical protein